ncbi:CAP domain-containing protein [filamentous cyanobacterium LEGE 11480]|uniref:CAP domain-containing protein n=1 Tax=Romeriopsis navalis LEGE 11480 TaxID=2777977 RepID=A0A928VR05_9CYAN|nr:CAP domain-containing protein [Romeriopsis navalis]MBE9030539.1 CAP domain-containing protein [Romeriopsis navalis LEGE 11480]
MPEAPNTNLSPQVTTLAAGVKVCDAQQNLTAKVCAGDGIESEERKLYRLLNEYRRQQGLPAIPLSPSLSLVANRHVRDFDRHTLAGHSWSNCRYDAANRSTYACMWQAPQRLGTAYPGNGYENSYGSSTGRVTAREALNSWKGSRSHNRVMLNQGVWKTQWQAVGIGIYQGRAVLWFGKERDPISE